MSEEMKLAVRESLRETAFRRYEGFIVDATKGSLVVDPKLQVPAMKTSSFKVGVREAIAGWKRFGYKSNGIPQGYDVGKIVVRELADGRIWLCNQHQDTVNKNNVMEMEASLVVDVGGNVAGWNQKVKVEPENMRKMEVVVEAELERWCQELDRDKNLRSQIAWLVRATQPWEIEFFRVMRMRYDGVDFEKLNHGWWRVGR